MLGRSKRAKGVTDKTTKIVEREVTFMVDPQADFISLVKHGANQEPFLVIKTKKKGEDSMQGRIIQRIIISKELPDAEADAFLAKVKTDDEKDYDGFLAYDQVNKELCDPESFGGVKLDKEGKVFAVTAMLKDGAVIKDLDKVVPETEMDVVFKEPVPWNIHYDIVDEMYAMQNAMMGTLNQSQSDIAWKKKVAQKAITYFRDFVGMALDNFTIDPVMLGVALEAKSTVKSVREVSIDSTVFDSAKEAAMKLKEELEKLTTIQKKEEAMEHLFESKEQVAEFISDTLAGIEKKRSEDEVALKSRKESEDAAASEKAKQDEVIRSLAASIMTLTEKVERMSTVLPASTAADAAADGEEAEAGKKAADEKAKAATGKESVFKGAFLRGALY